MAVWSVLVAMGCRAAPSAEDVPLGVDAREEKAVNTRDVATARDASPRRTFDFDGAVSLRLPLEVDVATPLETETSHGVGDDGGDAAPVDASPTDGGPDDRVDPGTSRFTTRACVAPVGMLHCVGTDVPIDEGHCGSCVTACPMLTPNGRSDCCVGGCQMLCTAGFADCDGAQPNGCEVDLAFNDGAHCGACGARCPEGRACVSGRCSLPPPTPYRPQSLSIVTTQRPTFAWRPLTDSTITRIEVCRDRACLAVDESADVEGTSYRASRPLTPGPHFWRLRALRGADVGAEGRTWMFVVPDREGVGDTGWPLVADIDGDGAEDHIGYSITRAGGGPPLTPQREIARSDIGEPWGFDRLVMAAAPFFVGDLDGDGYGDLIQAADYLFPDGVRTDSWLMGVVRHGGPDGLRDDGVASPTSVFSASGMWRSFRLGPLVGDVDADGRADLIDMSYEDVGLSGHTYWTLHLGTGVHRAADEGDAEAGVRDQWVPVGDLDRDGLSDVLSVQASPSYDRRPIMVLYGGADARTRPLTEIPPCRFGDAGAVSPNMLDEMRDVDGDGFVDLLTSRNAVRTMHGYGDWESAVRVLYRVGADGLRAERCELLP